MFCTSPAPFGRTFSLNMPLGNTPSTFRKSLPGSDLNGAKIRSRRSGPTALHAENANDFNGGRLASAAVGCENVLNLAPFGSDLESRK
jgi:hypothetical protein